MADSEGSRSFNASFCAAANSLAHLYRQSLQQQKISYTRGFKKAIDATSRFVTKQQQLNRSTVISVEALQEFLAREMHMLQTDESDQTDPSELEPLSAAVAAAEPSSAKQISVLAQSARHPLYNSVLDAARSTRQRDDIERNIPMAVEPVPASRAVSEIPDGAPASAAISSQGSNTPVRQNASSTSSALESSVQVAAARALHGVSAGNKKRNLGLTCSGDSPGSPNSLMHSLDTSLSESLHLSEHFTKRGRTGGPYVT
mmetsp:Transcript_12820/g.22103  ORF Transcript_12820/g.22103 Transcript_12820/m.22103 type:complete len:258 (-) Transcript_12820:522-1295(-)|eukprot:CAMPEP_0196663142 /NCGR_PEP_ID=MMETSP1086-20130531/51645_1 /TAXON_ID=77921 /ORGANISM="Cyanoptyche  gloeocystis , Strain SAG4.97" /LENGTH=257 /DNA_ID=CAMNT_0041998849 /DNA_START=114 /DNA_END=887 /DNA_ORIENTATION=-